MYACKRFTALILVLMFMFAAFLVAGCENKGKSAEKPTPTTTTTEKLADASWIIEFDDEITENNQGLDIIYRLKLTAEKPEGANASGVYTGNAVLTVKADFSKIPELKNSPIKVSGGIDVKATDNAVTLTVDEPVTLAPLVKPSGEKADDDTTLATLVPPKEDDDSSKEEDAEFTASGALTLSGMGKLDILAVAPDAKGEYKDAKSDTQSLNYSLAINGDTATITIDRVGTFKGTVSSFTLAPLVKK